MPSVSQIVRHKVQQKPMIYEGLIEGVISHAGLAEYLQDEIERELGKSVSLPSIVMAVRRYSETLEKSSNIPKKFMFNTEIIMKTGLADIAIVKTSRGIEKLKKLHTLVDFDRGDTLNIIHGNYETTVVISEKYLAKIKEILKGEKILNIEKDLVSLSVSFTNDFLHTPGVLSKVTRTLSWENINIFENISTMSEAIFIISSKDSATGYKALQRLVEKD